MQEQEPNGYALELSDWRALQEVKRRLYGDGRPLTPDERRDLANTLDAIMHRAVPV